MLEKYISHVLTRSSPSKSCYHDTQLRVTHLASIIYLHIFFIRIKIEELLRVLENGHFLALMDVCCTFVYGFLFFCVNSPLFIKALCNVELICISKD